MNCPKCCQPIRFGGNPPCGCYPFRVAGLTDPAAPPALFDALDKRDLELLEENKRLLKENTRLRAFVDEVERAVKGVVRDG